MVTVIIPTREDPYLNRTIENIYENAHDIEVIVVLDGVNQEVDERAVVIELPNPVGRRVAINMAAREAKGEYLFILDAHCSMTKDWDRILAESCEDNSIVVCAISDMNPETWEHLPGDYAHVVLNSRLEEKWSPKVPESALEEMMAFTGCAWLIPTKYFWELDGYDESLGEYGWDGPEWAMKVWLNDKHPGKVLLRSDVICGHIFGTNNNNALYQVNTIGYSKYYEKMYAKWGNKLPALFDKFGIEFEKQEVKSTTTYKTVVEKKEDIVKKDQDGKVVSHIVRYYKPFTIEHDGIKSDDILTQEALPFITEIDHEEVKI